MPAKTKAVPRDVAIERLRKAHVAGATKAQAKRDDAREKAIARINKKYGDGALITLAGAARDPSVAGIPTLVPRLDDLLTGETDDQNRTIDGTGVGIPRGRIVEIYGKEAVGKTTLVLLLIVAVQRAGFTAALVDAEHSLDVKYAVNLGVDMSRLIINQPASAEQALDIAHDLVANNVADAVFVDSVAALEPEDEADESVSKSTVALQARLMSKGLRKLTGPVYRANALLVMINQLRTKIGVTYGNKDTTTGGNSLKFYASIRMEMVMVKTLKKGTRVVGRRTRIRTVKNKAAPPFREIFVDIAMNRGIVATYPGDYDAGDDEDDTEAA